MPEFVIEAFRPEGEIEVGTVRAKTLEKAVETARTWGYFVYRGSPLAPDDGTLPRLRPLKPRRLGWLAWLVERER